MRMKRLIGTVFALILLLTFFSVLPTAVFADDSLSAQRTEKTPPRINYDVKVTVKVTEDAGGWNDAWIAINQRYESGTAKKTETKKITGLKDDFDNKTEFSYEKKGLQFPTSVDIYTDFGGGATFRKFQADVTVYVNGTNVASKHITASSSAFSSSDTTNTVTIDESKYPYPQKAYIDGIPETVQLENGYYRTEVRVSMLDQYNSSWDSYGMVLEDSLGNSFGSPNPVERYVSSEGKDRFVGYFSLVSINSNEDQKVTYTYTVNTANSVHSTVTASFSVQYKCPHKVRIVFDGTVRDTITGTADEEIRLDYPEFIQEGFDLEWTLEGGGLLINGDSDEAKYVFGASDGTLTANLVPYSFTVAFDGNGATKGTMASKIQRVGTTYTLPGNTYTNTGYEFAGWNTEPDGSGITYQNKGVVQDLSTVKGDVVTLYAQWKIKTYTVTFVNKVTGERIKQTVEYGGAAEAPEIEPYSVDENEHYVFSKWNKAFTDIKSNITVTSVHVLEAHTFTDEGGEHYCSVCGYGKTQSTETASIFSNGGIYVIAAVVLIMAAAAAAAVIVKKKRTSMKGKEV